MKINYVKKANNNGKNTQNKSTIYYELEQKCETIIKNETLTYSELDHVQKH